VDTLLDLGLRNALGGTVLAVLAACLGRVCRRPALRHSLWLLVLLKLVTPPLWPLPRPALLATPAPLDLRSPTDEDDPGAEPGEWPTRSASREPDETRSRSERTTLTALPDWKPVVLALWLTGSLLWWALAGVRLARFRRLLRFACPAPAALQEQARRLAARLGVGRCPGVWLVPAPVSPMLWALGGPPRLLLPAPLWERLTAEQQDTLLLHELAHQRRRDHWVRRLELAVLGLYWWHPVVWWARRELREAEEDCCDAWVVWALPEAARAYATALLETVTFLSQSRPALPATASGAGHVRPLKRRLTMILRGTPSRNLTWGGLLAVLALAALLLPLWPTWAEPPRDAPAGSKEGGETSPPADDAPPAFLLEGAGQRLPGPAEWDRAAGRPATAKERARAEQIQDLKDAIEVLEVQLDIKREEVKAIETALGSGMRDPRDRTELMTRLAIKRAELKEPEVRLRQARRKLEQLQPQEAGPLTTPRAESWAEKLFDEVAKDFGTVDRGQALRYAFRLTNRTKSPVHISSIRFSAACLSATADLIDLAPGQSGSIRSYLDTSRFAGAKTAKIHVIFDRPEPAEVVLTVQATSRDAGEKPRPTDPRQRLEDLERKLNDVLKEIDALKREVEPRRPGGSGAAGRQPVYQSRTRKLTIPVHVDPARVADLKELRLFCSRDGGETWTQIAALPAQAKDFTYLAPTDGVHGFTVVMVGRDGRQTPADLVGTKPSLVVDVDTTASLGP
jgi:beta-lactamase regulating signal transducer with metallopeptidase domain